jgi:hypothetical protein
MGIELVNAPSMDATHRKENNEQHQNETELVVQRDPITFLATHQVTP